MLYQEEKENLRMEIKKLYTQIERRNASIAEMINDNNHDWALLSAYMDQYCDLNEED